VGGSSVESSWRGLFGETDLEGVLGEGGGDEMGEKGLGSVGIVEVLRIAGVNFGFDGAVGIFNFAGGTLIGIMNSVVLTQFRSRLSEPKF